ncbi:uncharacterized protein [Rutidosis leptorrhynchoides]|uniref:uncharacterized protein n=1 Tax=Rutidosis leptorrhynchoides TaxID=125765 RepID=UPI003A9A58D4
MPTFTLDDSPEVDFTTRALLIALSRKDVTSQLLNMIQAIDFVVSDVGAYEKASISVLVNGSPTREFSLERGVRQGDPLSPFLFIIAAEGLNVMVKRAVCNKKYIGVEIGRDKVPIPHLQYADDTIFYGEWSEENLRNLFKLLKCFEKTSGLKVNYLKSILYGVGVGKCEVENLAKSFGCNAGSFPFTYLGLPVGGRMNKIECWSPVIEKFSKRLSDWKARSFSFGGRLTLVKSIGKWWWRFKSETNSLWVKVISSIHGSSGGLSPCLDGNYYLPYNSVWTNIVKAGSDIDSKGISFTNSFVRIIGNGLSTSFWNDFWLGNFSLKSRFERLFYLDSDPNVTVAGRLGQSGFEGVGNWDWVREPTGRAAGSLTELKVLLQGIKLDDQKNDTWGWSLSGNGFFKTKTLTGIIDSKLLKTPQSFLATLHNYLVPKKVEVFIWRVRKGRIPVLTNLDKRGVDLHSVRCPICDNGVEYIQHSLLSCRKTLEIWGKIFDWWRATLPSSIDINNLIEGSSNIFSSELGKNIWQAVLWSCAYLVWKNRNEKVFNNKCWNIQVAVSEIQIKSFEWVAKRCKTKRIEWHDWLHNPHNAIA